MMCPNCLDETKIRTIYNQLPIPDRRFDWSAICDGCYDYDHPVGRGETAIKAIEDLKEYWEEEEA